MVDHLEEVEPSKPAFFHAHLVAAFVSATILLLAMMLA